jgi:HSP20 family protein
LEDEETAMKTQEIERRQERRFVRPRVDVWENDAELMIVADVPGVDREHVELQVEDGELRIEAKRTAAPHGTVLVAEQAELDYRRAFALPDGLDADKIDAELKDGVLLVHLPKTASKRTRRIEVKASG